VFHRVINNFMIRAAAQAGRPEGKATRAPIVLESRNGGKPIPARHDPRWHAPTIELGRRSSSSTSRTTTF
jgi:hypothetical protein